MNNVRSMPVLPGHDAPVEMLGGRRPKAKGQAKRKAKGKGRGDDEEPKEPTKRDPELYQLDLKKKQLQLQRETDSWLSEVEQDSVNSGYQSRQIWI